MASESSNEMINTLQMYRYFVKLKIKRFLSYFHKQWNEEDEKTVQWKSPFAHLFFSICLVLGVSNVLEFSNHCFRFGGLLYSGCFLVLYAIVALPMLYIECFIGQYTRTSPVRAYAQILRGLQGFAVAQWVLSFYNSVSNARTVIDAFIYCSKNLNYQRFVYEIFNYLTGSFLYPSIPTSGQNISNTQEVLINTLSEARSLYSNTTGSPIGSTVGIAMALCLVVFIATIWGLRKYPAGALAILLLILQCLLPLILFIAGTILMFDSMKSGLSAQFHIRKSPDSSMLFHAAFTHVFRSSCIGTGVHAHLASMNFRRRTIHSTVITIAILDIAITIAFAILFSPVFSFISETLQINADLIINHALYEPGNGGGLLFAAYPASILVKARIEDDMDTSKHYLAALYFYVAFTGLLSLVVITEYQAVTLHKLIAPHANTKLWVSKLLTMFIYILLLIPLCCKGGTVFQFAFDLADSLLRPTAIALLSFAVAWALPVDTLKQWLDRNQQKHMGPIVWYLLSTWTPLLSVVSWLIGLQMIETTSEIDQVSFEYKMFGGVVYLAPTAVFVGCNLALMYGKHRYSFSALKTPDLDNILDADE